MLRKCPEDRIQEKVPEPSRHILVYTSEMKKYFVIFLLNIRSGTPT